MSKTWMEIEQIAAKQLVKQAGKVMKNTYCPNDK